MNLSSKKILFDENFWIRCKVRMHQFIHFQQTNYFEFILFFGVHYVRHLHLMKTNRTILKKYTENGCELCQLVFKFGEILQYLRFYERFCSSKRNELSVRVFMLNYKCIEKKRNIYTKL